MSNREPTKMSREQRRTFFRALATMLSAGLSLLEALDYLDREKGEDEIRTVVERLRSSLVKGQRLSTSLQQTGLFPSFHCSLIRVGEETGSLSLVLQRLAFHEENTMALRQMIVSRMTYPAVLFAVALTMLIVLPAFCLEGLFQVLENAQVALPLLTRGFIGASRFLASPIVLIGLPALAVGAYKITRRALYGQANRDRGWRVLLRLPIIGKPLRCLSLATFTEALALQLTVGLSPLPALGASVRLTEDPELREDVELAIELIRDGATLGEAFREADAVTPMLHSMINVGEESGTLPHLLEKTAKYYALEVDTALEQLASALEPLVLVVMGVVFGLIMVALMNPLVSMLQSL
ncbi:MAG: type II secretion system F family protein [Candidatus Eremiobacteraeota bacterium]|nr:type II secretion system F family protein [Candidatus Eremiobacteraeota bacterium]